MTLSLELGRSLNYIPRRPPNAIITIINGTWHKSLPHITLSHNRGVMAFLWCNAASLFVSVSGSQILRVQYLCCRLNANVVQGTFHTSNKIQFHPWVCGCELSGPICNLFQKHWLYQYNLDTDWKGAEIHLWLHRRPLSGQYKFCLTVNHFWLRVNYAALLWAHKVSPPPKKSSPPSCFMSP